MVHRTGRKGASSRPTGFSEAELAAAEWRRMQDAKEGSESERQRRHRHHQSPTSSSSASPDRGDSSKTRPLSVNHNHRYDKSHIHRHHRRESPDGSYGHRSTRERQETADTRMERNKRERNKYTDMKGGKRSEGLCPRAMNSKPHQSLDDAPRVRVPHVEAQKCNERRANSVNVTEEGGQPSEHTGPSLRPTEVTLEKIREIGKPSNPLGQMYQAATIGVMQLQEHYVGPRSGSTRTGTLGASSLASRTKGQLEGETEESDARQVDDEKVREPGVKESLQTSESQRVPRSSRSASEISTSQSRRRHDANDEPQSDASHYRHRRRGDAGGKDKTKRRERRSSERERERDRIPRCPINPLDAAYDRQAYRQQKVLRKKGRGRRSDDEQEPPWAHDRYLDRSESPNRERTEGPMWDTRKDAWMSRAGGAYLPPRRLTSESDDFQEDEPKHNPNNPRTRTRSPARYRYPDQFRRIHEDKRRRFGHGARDGSPRSRSRSRSSSARARDSPVYALD